MIQVPRDDIIIMLEAGYIYLAMKKFKEARGIFDGICELAPKHDVPQVGVANVYFFQGKFLETIRTLKIAIKDNPNSAYAYSHLGEAYLFYGKREEALKTLQKASELEPKKEQPTGEFARSLINLINLGYDPVEYRKAFNKFAEERGLGEKKK